MTGIGVANVNRTENGTRYMITDDDNRKVATVDSFSGVYGMHDVDGEPVRVGSPLYDSIVRAIEHYEAWSAAH